MHRLLKTALTFLLAGSAMGVSGGASAQSRIKDIVSFEGMRDNLLVGYGLVVGLQGTGDKLGSAVFTRESIVGMLSRLGVNTRGAEIQTKNVAAVMVTAVLPPFARQGSRIDLTVSALGDSKSLLGGTLLVTPMIGADGEVYAVGQGQLAVGGFTAVGLAETVSKGVPTNARIASGAIIEREVPFELAELSKVRLALRNPDFTTARRVAAAVNGKLGMGAAIAIDPGTVSIDLAKAGGRDVVAMIGDIEQLPVRPDLPARVVIDEQTGVIVMGDMVRISTVAIAQGNLTIRITETPQVSQAAPLSEGGETKVVPRTSVQVDEGGDKQLAVLKSGVSLQELVSGLNALGIGPRDMISILQSIKVAGALQAEIQVM
jgi:flagellar P-ring protein FlgI